MSRSLAGEAKVASGGCTESTEIHSNFESQSENVVMCRDTHSDLFVRFFFSLRCFLSQSYVRQHAGTYTIYIYIHYKCGPVLLARTGAHSCASQYSVRPGPKSVINNDNKYEE